MQLGANIIDEANPTQYPTHIVYPFSAGPVLRSAYGAMDLPYLDSVTNVRYIVQTPTPPTLLPLVPPPTFPRLTIDPDHPHPGPERNVWRRRRNRCLHAGACDLEPLRCPRPPSAR